MLQVRTTHTHIYFSIIIIITSELEFFKSQLILASINHPNIPLNDLIDMANEYMSPGVSFGSRESLKKSLTVARKSNENGGFRLRCYKSSEAPKSVRSHSSTPSSVAAVLGSVDAQYMVSQKKSRLLLHATVVMSCTVCVTSVQHDNF